MYHQWLPSKFMGSWLWLVRDTNNGRKEVHWEDYTYDICPQFWLVRKSEGEVKSLSHVQLFVTPRTIVYQDPLSWDFPGKNTGVGCHFPLQERPRYWTQVCIVGRRFTVWGSREVTRKSGVCSEVSNTRVARTPWSSGADSTSTAGGTGSLHGQETHILLAVQFG